MVEGRAHRPPLMVSRKPGLGPAMEVGAAVAAENQASDEAGGNTAVAAESDEEPALGPRVAAAFPQTFERATGIECGLIVELLHKVEERLHLVQGGRGRFGGKLVSLGEDFLGVAFDVAGGLERSSGS